MSINSENKKMIRKPFYVGITLEQKEKPITRAVLTNVYGQGTVTLATQSEVESALNVVDMNRTLMDLSDGGFYNDGEAVPYTGSERGYYFSTSVATITVTCTVSSPTDTGLVNVFGYVDGRLTKWTTDASTPLTIATNGRRIRITEVLFGHAFNYDNSNLVSCSGVLRAVETKADNPSLQVSEIEIQGYEPNNISEYVGYMDIDRPIYYICGYEGELTMRKFYLSDTITLEDNVISIKGQDATKFMEQEFEGKYMEDGARGGIAEEFETLRSELQSTVRFFIDEYTYPDVAFYNDCVEHFLPKMALRDMVAYFVNVYRLRGTVDAQGVRRPVCFNYVDAGNPRLFTETDFISKEIGAIGRPTIKAEQVTQRLEENLYYTDEKAQKVIQTFDQIGVQILNFDTPYSSLILTGGEVLEKTPYYAKVKINTTSAVLYGTPVSMYDYSAGSNTPYVVTRGTHGKTITLPDWPNTEVVLTRSGGVVTGATYLIQSGLNQVIGRSNILYEFEYRGDPRLNPREYIKADVDGSGTQTEMTIDTIEFSHEGGGYKQIITARKGLI